MKQAVILCGGYGKRLGAKTKKTPKPLIKVNGSPFLNNIIFNTQDMELKFCYYVLINISYFLIVIIKKLFNCDITCFHEVNHLVQLVL